MLEELGYLAVVDAHAKLETVEDEECHCFRFTQQRIGLWICALVGEGAVEVVLSACLVGWVSVSSGAVEADVVEYLGQACFYVIVWPCRLHLMQLDQRACLGTTFQPGWLDTLTIASATIIGTLTLTATVCELTVAQVVGLTKMGSGPGVVAGLTSATEAIGPEDITLVLEWPSHLQVCPVNVKPVAFPAAIGPLDSITVAAIVDFRIGLDLPGCTSERRSSLSSRGPSTSDPSSICC